MKIVFDLNNFSYNTNFKHSIDDIDDAKYIPRIGDFVMINCLNKSSNKLMRTVSEVTSRLFDFDEDKVIIVLEFCYQSQTVKTVL